MNYNKFIEIITSKLGEPDSLGFLKEYLEFTLNYSNTSNKYSENHHILPKSQFPEYLNEKWNIVNLVYEDHVFAHELLFLAYNNRSNHRPLQFMRSQISKDSKLISKSSKKGWISLKSNVDKYSKWIEGRSKYMKSLSFEERSRRSKLAWVSLTDSEYFKRCEINSKNWTKSRKKEKSNQMIEYFKNNPDEMSNRSKRMWDNMDPTKKEEFISKMTLVNQDINKRNNAGKSIKNRWKDPNFREKMMDRKTSKRKITAISPNGEVIEFDGLMSMIEQYGFNRQLVNKYRNTGKPVESKNVKNKKSIANTIGWKFNYTKYGETNIS
jgi:hypothetical protein